MKIGILGGAFNPPHIGHLVLAQDMLKALGLDKIFFIPTNRSPHKQGCRTEAVHRLKMVQLNIAGNRRYEAMDLEIKRGGISYTIDTIKELKELYSRSEFYLIVGSDLAGAFSSWHKFEDLRTMVKIAVARRDNYPLDNKNSFLMVDIRQVDISSSRIRELISKGDDVRPFLKQRVFDYIAEHKLYTFTTGRGQDD